MNKNRDDILSLLMQTPGKVLIVSHIDPDGDTIGAAAALYDWLRSQQRDVAVYCKHTVPMLYEWAFSHLLEQQIDEQVDILVCVDCASPDRLGEVQSLLLSVPTTICLDHHYTNPGYCHYNYIDAKASSTCEILTSLFQQKGVQWSEYAAQALYIGLVTDSGQFSFDSVREETLLAAAANIRRGARSAEINNRIFKNRTLAKTMLIGQCLNSLELYNNGKIALMHMNKEMLGKCGATYEDGENIINYAIEIQGCELAVLLKQQTMAYKVSIRTDGDYDAAALASRMNGGGHNRAAGCTLSPVYEEALETLKNALEAEIGTKLERDL